MIMYKRGCFLIGAALAAQGIFMATVAASDYQEFFDTQGRKIEAKLLSHKGDGTVKIEMKGGKEYTLPITKFGKLDQQMIKDWIEKTPPAIDYNFLVEFKEDRSDTDVRRPSYMRIKTNTVIYEVKITNRSRDVVSGLTFDWRAFMYNEAESDHRASGSEVGLFALNGSVELPAAMRYNDSLDVKTKPFELHDVEYFYVYGDEHYKDRMAGLMLRAKNAAGKVVWEYKSNDKEIAAQVWDEAKEGGKGKAVAAKSDVEQPKRVN
ncbi:MAG: hypothetical protein AAGJ79_08725 [Verrucomicrobiota bacterium]